MSPVTPRAAGAGTVVPVELLTHSPAAFQEPPLPPFQSAGSGRETDVPPLMPPPEAVMPALPLVYGGV